MILNEFREKGIDIRLAGTGDLLDVTGLSSQPGNEAEELRARIIQNRQQILEELKESPKYDIEPMWKCLHQEPCAYLISERGESPWCNAADKLIFDLEKCPRDLWFQAQPSMGSHNKKSTTITVDNCPARCARTGRCHHIAAFHHKIGPSRECRPRECEYLEGSTKGRVGGGHKSK